MTDEEMAKKWVEDNKYGIEEYCLSTEDFGEHGFLAGLKASKTHWHDLRKDPNDLPKEDQLVLLYRVNPLGANLSLTNWFNALKDTEIIYWQEIELPVPQAYTDKRIMKNPI